jgi:hypothetical protein
MVQQIVQFPLVFWALLLAPIEVEPAVGRPKRYGGAAAGGELVITHEHHASTGRRTRMRQPLRSIGACWLSSGADDGYSERLNVSGASQRHSGILERH